MPDELSNEILAGLVAALAANAALVALVGGRIYDEPPTSAAHPFVRVGNINLQALRSDCATDHDVLFSIEVHSRPDSGRVEAARIAGAVRDALDDAPFSVDGWVCEWCLYQTQAAFMTDDGQTYIATVAFSAAISAP